MTVLTAEEEAIAVAFRQNTLLPLGDCLYALQEKLFCTSHARPCCFQRWTPEQIKKWT